MTQNVKWHKMSNNTKCLECMNQWNQTICWQLNVTEHLIMQWSKLTGQTTRAKLEWIKVESELAQSQERDQEKKEHTVQTLTYIPSFRFGKLFLSIFSNCLLTHANYWNEYVWKKFIFGVMKRCGAHHLSLGVVCIAANIARSLSESLKKSVNYILIAMTSAKLCELVTRCVQVFPHLVSPLSVRCPPP